jgi:MSHA biogenesis protein MshP
MNGQRGFGAIMAIVILVILAALAAAMINFSTVQQTTSAQDILSAKAWQAAKAGNEWGLYQALKNTSCVGGAGTTLNLSAATGMRVTVVCNSWTYNEGQTCATLPCVAATVTVYQVVALACNSSTGCPDATMAVSPGYIERKREVIATN